MDDFSERCEAEEAAERLLGDRHVWVDVPPAIGVFTETQQDRYVTWESPQFHAMYQRFRCDRCGTCVTVARNVGQDRYLSLTGCIGRRGPRYEWTKLGGGVER